MCKSLAASAAHSYLSANLHNVTCSSANLHNVTCSSTSSILSAITAQLGCQTWYWIRLAKSHHTITCAYVQEAHRLRQQLADAKHMAMQQEQTLQGQLCSLQQELEHVRAQNAALDNRWSWPEYMHTCMQCMTGALPCFMWLIIQPVQPAVCT